MSFPLLIGLMGAARVEAAEPESLNACKEWQLLQGLGEMALQCLIGEAGQLGLDTSPRALGTFVHLGPLFRGEPMASSLAPGLAWKQSTAESLDLAPTSVDLLTSRSVMEHVANPAAAYAAMARILRPGGVLHHDIDFTAHDPERFAFYWREPSGTQRAAFDGLNELRLSDHVGILQRLGLEVTLKRREQAAESMDRTALAPRFAHYSDDDLRTTRAVLIGRKAGESQPLSA